MALEFETLLNPPICQLIVCVCELSNIELTQKQFFLIRQQQQQLLLLVFVMCTSETDSIPSLPFGTLKANQSGEAQLLEGPKILANHAESP